MAIDGHPDDDRKLSAVVAECWIHYNVTLGRPPTTAEIWKWLDDRSPQALAENPEGTLPFD